MSIAEIIARKKAAAQAQPVVAQPDPLNKEGWKKIISNGLAESGSVAEEDLEDMSVEEFERQHGVPTKVNGEKHNAGSVHPEQPTQAPVQAETLGGQALASEILRTYHTIEELRASPLWKLLSIVRRIELGREYAKQSRLGGDKSHVVPEPVAPAEEAQGAVGPVVGGALERIPPPEQGVPLTAGEKLMMRFPSIAALKQSAYYKGLSIVDQAMVSREYTKTLQNMARDAYAESASKEQQIADEEKRKAMDQKAFEEKQPQKHEAFALTVELNAMQQMAVDYAKAGKSFVLTGPAGTGKTTACRAIGEAFLQMGDRLGSHSFKTEGGEVVSSHGIAFCSFTRRATSNIRRALHKSEKLAEEFEHNVVTVHRLLEYQPEFYTDPSAPTVTKMRFVPKRTAARPLNIKVLVLEEASMLGLDLYEKLYDALRPGTVIVFVGDINQLPPVFGKSIMNYALGQLPVVNLTEVYRQAFDSGILVDAYKVLEGKPPEGNKDVVIVEGSSTVQVGQEKMSRAMGAMFHQLFKNKEYDPNQDILLSPWNKQPMGTANINSWIAQFLGDDRHAMVYEVLASRQKLYLAVGDRVMYEKQDGVITGISHNAQYLGKAPQPASTALTRFGLRRMSGEGTDEDFELAGGAAGYAAINLDEVADEEKKQQASHIVKIRLDGGEEEELSAVGDFAEAKFSLGYCLTVHKAQGCEWRKVYLLMHKDHSMGMFMSRELLYTAMTRAREKLILIAKKKLLAKAAGNAIIKGNTLEEKIASINSGATNIGSYPVIKQ